MSTAVLVVICLWYNHAWFYDDAFITLRYAKHIAEGFGPRWNLSGAPVEGFTSPTHVFAVAALLRLHIPDRIALQLIGFLSHTILIWFVWRWTRSRYGAMPAALAACMVAVSFPILMWDLGGLESVPFATLVTAGTLLSFQYIQTPRRRDLLQGALLLGLAALTRMDGGIAAVAAFAAVALLSKGSVRQRATDLLLASMIVAACLLPWQIFREMYFHAPLPNTYYAKVYGIALGWRIHSGLLYWKIYLKMAPYSVELLVLIAAAQLRKQRVNRLHMDRLPVAMWLWVAVLAAYIVSVGGDHMAAARFMVTIIPLVSVATVAGLASLGAFASPAPAMAVAAVFVLTSAFQFRSPILNPRFEGSASVASRVIAEYLGPRLPAGAWVGVNTAGAMPYLEDHLNYIDMLGLNDYEIARRNPVPLDPGKRLLLVGHLKGDGLSVMRRHPDVLLFGPPGGQRIFSGDPMLLGDAEAAQTPELARDYQLCTAKVTATPEEQKKLAEVNLPPTLGLFYYLRRGTKAVCEHGLE